MGKRRYRKISVCIWNDAKFLALSHDAKLVLFFMLTHQDLTQLGALRATVPGLACELGMELEVFGKAFEEVLQQRIVEYDEKLLFWFPNFLKHNLPESPNVVKSWHYGYCELPESALRTDILLGVKELVATLTQGFQEAFTCTFAEELAGTFPNQRTDNREQEEEKRVDDSPACPSQTALPDAFCGSAIHQKNLSVCTSNEIESPPLTDTEALPVSSAHTLNETSPRSEQETSLPPDSHTRSREDVSLAGAGQSPPAGGNTIQTKTAGGKKNQEKPPEATAATRTPCPYEKIQHAYNSICTSLPKCRDITPQRKARLKSAWNSGLDRKNLAWWERYFALVHQSTFLSGENDRGWTANFDWVVKPANMIKIEEGNYLPKQGKSQKGTGKAAGVSATNRAVYESMMQRS